LVSGEIPDWWVWANWVSPLTYAFHAMSVNEMYAPRWMHNGVSNILHFVFSPGKIFVCF
jgi:ABC-type multidrug transport system permease subunit